MNISRCCFDSNAVCVQADASSDDKEVQVVNLLGTRLHLLKGWRESRVDLEELIRQQTDRKFDKLISSDSLKQLCKDLGQGATNAVELKTAMVPIKEQKELVGQLMLAVKRTSDAVKKYKAQMDRQAQTLQKRQEQRDRVAAKKSAASVPTPKAGPKTQIHPVFDEESLKCPAMIKIPEVASTAFEAVRHSDRNLADQAFDGSMPYLVSGVDFDKDMDKDSRFRLGVLIFKASVGKSKQFIDEGKAAQQMQANDEAMIRQNVLKFAPDVISLPDTQSACHWVAAAPNFQGFARELQHMGAVHVQVSGSRQVRIASYSNVVSFVRRCKAAPDDQTITPVDITTFMLSLSPEHFETFYLDGIIWHGTVSQGSLLYVPAGSYVMERNTDKVMTFSWRTSVLVSCPAALLEFRVMRDLLSPPGKPEPTSVGFKCLVGMCNRLAAGVETQDMEIYLDKLQEVKDKLKSFAAEDARRCDLDRTNVHGQPASPAQKEASACQTPTVSEDLAVHGPPVAGGSACQPGRTPEKQHDAPNSSEPTGAQPETHQARCVTLAHGHM